MQITLFIPDMAALCAVHSFPQRLPVLETLLAHAKVQPAPDNNAIVTGVFGLSGELTPAPFMRLADTGKRDHGFYFRADPAHLAPDRDQLLMLPLSVMQVKIEEAAALAETFNRTYGRDGYHLETPVAERWYLHCPKPLSCVTHAPANVIGQAVFEFMPSGRDGARLRQIMNEVQMLFYEHTVNQAREAASRPAINSMWPWGGGCLPEGSIGGPERVTTNMPLIAGLARFAGSDCTNWPDRLEFPAGEGEMFMGIKVEGEMAMTLLEQQLALPLLNAVRQGRVMEAMVYPGNGHSYRITLASLRQFWRRRRPLIEILCAS